MFLSPTKEHFCFSLTDDRLPSSPGGLFYKPIKCCKHTGALNYSHYKTLMDARDAKVNAMETLSDLKHQI